MDEYGIIVRYIKWILTRARLKSLLSIVTTTQVNNVAMVIKIIRDTELVSK
jgi:hypothetical protein